MIIFCEAPCCVIFSPSSFTLVQYSPGTCPQMPSTLHSCSCCGVFTH
jgi:hypothetical protein